MSFYIVLFSIQQHNLQIITVFRFSVGIIITAILISLVSFFLAMIAIKKSKRQRTILSLFFIAIISGLLFSPALINSRITVYQDRIEEVAGFFPFEDSQTLLYNEINFIQIRRESDNGRFIEFWQVHYSDGSSRDIQISNLWALHSEEITTIMKSHGVKFTHSS